MNWIKRIFGIKPKPIPECNLPYINDIKREGKPIYGFKYEKRTHNSN